MHLATDGLTSFCLLSGAAARYKRRASAPTAAMRSAVLRLSDHSDQPLASAKTRKSSYQDFQLPGHCPGRARYSGSDNGWNILRSSCVEYLVAT